MKISNHIVSLQILLTEHSKLAVPADKNPPLPSASTTANPPSKGLYSIARKLTPSVFKGIAKRIEKKMSLNFLQETLSVSFLHIKGTPMTAQREKNPKKDRG